ncbi:hypothetical protein SAY86_016350 [Trapa natans]|uniref:GOLD domain-containing protein n=1 Tax=Trapa natans TaxID=22666 RepID=A0AAN7L6P9_TRANT|nr:hypothetical protein SAY86_016350 [Trapa natans]
MFEVPFGTGMVLWSNRAAGALIVLLGLVFGIVNGVRFEVYSGHGKCISEEIKAHSMTVGKYSIVNPIEGQPLPDDYRVTVKVTSPHGNNYHNGNHVSSGNFAFTATESGDYSTCFYLYDRKPPRATLIEFEWKTGVAATDWSGVAKKEHLDAVQVELKKLYHTVISIHDEMFYLREREREMQNLNKSTDSKMISFGYLSLLICLSVAGLQFWHLKTYFERKKLV